MRWDRLIEAAAAEFGHLDILVCNHARSGGDGPLGTLTAAMLDAHWAVNTRSAILLAQVFAALVRHAAPYAGSSRSPPARTCSARRPRSYAQPAPPA